MLPQSGNIKFHVCFYADLNMYFDPFRQYSRVIMNNTKTTAAFRSQTWLPSNWAKLGFLLGPIMLIAVYLHERLALADALIDPIPRTDPLYILRMIITLTGFTLVLGSCILVGKGQVSIPRQRFIWWCSIGVLAMQVAFIALFIISPIWFFKVTDEDRPVEWFSALCLLVGSGLMIYFAVTKAQTRLVRVIALGIGLTFFVIGMEEVSWFQRVIRFDTPELLANNSQEEANIHNLDSSSFEEIYYLGGFVLLIAAPFIAARMRLQERFPQIAILFPSMTVLVLSMPSSLYNYHLWNRASTQVIFFGTLLIVGYVSLQSLLNRQASWQERFLALFLFANFIVGQGALFVFPDHLLVPWVASEPKEMFIALGLCVYAIDVVVRSRSQAKLRHTV